MNHTVDISKLQPIRLLRNKYMEFKASNGSSGAFKTYALFSMKMVSMVRRLLTARIYLRQCTKVGDLVTVNGKPLIKAKGDIILGDRVAIWSVFDRTKLLVHENATLTVGNASRINGAHISVKESVTIGDHVRIGPYTLIMDSDFHDAYDHDREGKCKQVIIGDGVWIASKVTILKGVKIGEGAMIAAGAVVTKDVPAYTMAAGVPARIIRKLK